MQNCFLCPDAPLTPIPRAGGHPASLPSVVGLSKPHSEANTVFPPLFPPTWPSNSREAPRGRNATVPQRPNRTELRGGRLDPAVWTGWGCGHTVPTRPVRIPCLLSLPRTPPPFPPSSPSFLMLRRGLPAQRSPPRSGACCDECARFPVGAGAACTRWTLGVSQLCLVRCAPGFPPAVGSAGQASSLPDCASCPLGEM